MIYLAKRTCQGKLSGVFIVDTLYPNTYLNNFVIITYVFTKDIWLKGLARNKHSTLFVKDSLWANKNVSRFCNKNLRFFTSNSYIWQKNTLAFLSVIH
jgi:hypothetical protein